MAAIILRPEPYDPDAKDADGDGIVQERTPWERPVGTRLLDFSGSDIERGRSLTERPAGLRIVDKQGKDVTYTPSYERQGIAGRSQLSVLGHLSLREQGSKTVREVRGPRVVRAPEKLASSSFDADIRRATTLLRPVGDKELFGLSPRERRSVLLAKRVAEKVLERVDEPEERAVFSTVALNAFYWATTIADKSGVFTNLLNNIWAGSQDAGYNPHQVIEDMYQWGGATALAMPLLMLKERMGLSRDQMRKVADRIGERFKALKIRSGEMNEDLKLRFTAAMDSVRAAWKSRESKKVSQVEQLTEIFDEAIDRGRLTPEVPKPDDVMATVEQRTGRIDGGPGTVY